MRKGPYTAENVAILNQNSPIPDIQAHLVYNAEHHLRDVRVLSLPKTRKYVSAITDSQWWRSRVPRKAWHLSVTASCSECQNQDHAEADYANSKIVLPKWARERVTILHELTHIIHQSRRNKQAWHGPEYTWIESRVFKKFEPDLYEPLMESFDYFEVKTKRLWRV